MAEQTTNLKMTKPAYNDWLDIVVLNEDLDILDRKIGELDGRKVDIPPDFDNLLAWAGCKRVTPKKEGNSYTETITDKASGKLRAKRVTVQNGENDYTETYTFYGKDGSSVVQKYVVRTTKDGTETWTEDVTKEVG